MDESFDNELRRRLKQFSEEPEGRLWPSISARIEAEDRAVRLQKKMRIGWVFIFASIMIGGFFYFFKLEPKRNRSIVAAQSQAPLKKVAPNEVVATPNAGIQIPSENTQDTRETEGRYPNQNVRNFESSGLLDNQISEAIANTSEKEGQSLDDPANQIEMSNRSNSTGVRERAVGLHQHFDGRQSRRNE